MAQVPATLDVLRSIAYFCDKYGGKTRVSATTLAKHAQVNRDTVFASLPKLERAGYVRITHTNETGVKINWYEVLPAGRDVLAHLGTGSRNEGSRRSDQVVGNPNPDSVVPSSTGTTRTGTTTEKDRVGIAEAPASAGPTPSPSDRERRDAEVAAMVADFTGIVSRGVNHRPGDAIRLQEVFGEDLPRLLGDSISDIVRCDICGTQVTSRKQLHWNDCNVGRMRGRWWIHDGACKDLYWKLLWKEHDRTLHRAGR